MFKIYSVSLVLIAASLSSNQQIPKKFDKMVKISKFAPCNTSSSMIEFNTSTLLVEGGINELNIVGYLNITRDIPSPIRMQMTSQKCDPQGLNCENYVSFGYPDCCHLADIPFFSFLQGFEPQIRKCPLKKAIMKTSGIRYNLFAWTQLAMNNKYMTKYNFYDKDMNTVFCFEKPNPFQSRKRCFPVRNSRRPKNKKDAVRSRKIPR